MSESVWKLWRDVLLVALGIFMLGHETLSSGPTDPIIVGAALALLGLPPTLRLDERRRKNGNGGGGE